MNSKVQKVAGQYPTFVSMLKPLHILNASSLDEYLQTIPGDIKERFENLTDAEISTESFSFYTSVSSVFSSKIEGEAIELDSYVKHKRFGVEFKPDYTMKIDDLYNAYIFAQQNELSEKNIAEAHKVLTRNILPPHLQGELRKQNMYVTTPDGKIEYVAASPFEASGEMEKFYTDLEILLHEELSFEAVLFFAAMLHLVFVKIHPWNDGNGRTARLLEKWFIAQKLGKKAWLLQTEKYYYENHDTYYENIRTLGLEYEGLNYSKSLPFLLMLPASI